jgi:hypothetical protein
MYENSSILFSEPKVIIRRIPPVHRLIFHMANQYRAMLAAVIPADNAALAD